MEIKVVTNGFQDGTKMFINGEEITEMIQFHLAMSDRGRLKLQLHRIKDKKYEPMSLYGDDFLEFDKHSGNGGIKNDTGNNK